VKPEQKKYEASRNRRLVSQLLVAALFAVAYSETVAPVTEAFDESGVNLQSLAWMAIYMATVLRFFIGNILHLESPDLTGPDGAFRWFWDLFCIVLQCVVLIFAGAVTTIHSSAVADVSFTDYLLVLYGLDVFWLTSIRVLDWLGRRWPRSFGSMVRKKDKAPFEWAVVNVILGLTIWGLGLVGHHSSSIPDRTLWILLIVNAAATVYDVVRIAYGIREPEAANVSRLAPPIGRFGTWRSGSAEAETGRREPLDADHGMSLAISSARQSLEEGGIPIGAALLDSEGRVLGVGHNRRLQKGSPILHAEMDCLANASRRHDYSGTTLYSTLMPCYMCAGAIIQFGIPHVVAGESKNFSGARDLLEKHGVEVDDMDDSTCKNLLGDFIGRNPQTWREDIGG
jgi:cytosine/creatinine deaminase